MRSVPFHLNDVADNFELPAPPPGAGAIDVELRDAINKLFPGTAFDVPNSTFTRFGVELQNTQGAADAATLPFVLQGSEGNGGNITGLAAIGTNLYAVTDRGSLYQILYGTPTPGFYNPNGATLQWIANINDPTSNQSIAFHGLTIGPPDVDNGAYANTLFATSESGMLYAFDSKGNLLPVFHNASAAATERQSFIQLPGVAGGNTQGSWWALPYCFTTTSAWRSRRSTTICGTSPTRTPMPTRASTSPTTRAATRSRRTSRHPRPTASTSAWRGIAITPTRHKTRLPVDSLTTQRPPTTAAPRHLTPTTCRAAPMAR